jgi:hypothetical protein
MDKVSMQLITKMSTILKQLQNDITRAPSDQWSQKINSFSTSAISTDLHSVAAAYKLQNVCFTALH